MLTQNNPACIRILFDDHRLVPMPACSCRPPSPGTSACGHSSTICETYGLAKEGARHHGYTGARGYHPLLATAAGTGEVLRCPVCARGGYATAGPEGNSRCGPTAASTPTLS